MKKIKSALISVYHKDRLDEIVSLLDTNGVKIYSTGGTYDFINKMGIKAETVESLTGYPSILGGRVKTLHPKVFGGILGRRELGVAGRESPLPRSRAAPAGGAAPGPGRRRRVIPAGHRANSVHYRRRR